MKRRKLQQLYSCLRDNSFAFLGKGDFHLRDVYAAVKKMYPQLCDDDYMCSESCIKGNPRDPEWHHRVRTILQDLKRAGGSVRNGISRGWWSFS
jgi:hypothetical protein